MPSTEQKRIGLRAIMQAVGAEAFDRLQDQANETHGEAEEYEEAISHLFTQATENLANYSPPSVQAELLLRWAGTIREATLASDEPERQVIDFQVGRVADQFSWEIWWWIVSGSKKREPFDPEVFLEDVAAFCRSLLEGTKSPAPPNPFAWLLKNAPAIEAAYKAIPRDWKRGEA